MTTAVFPFKISHNVRMAFIRVHLQGRHFGGIAVGAYCALLRSSPDHRVLWGYGGATQKSEMLVHAIDAVIARLKIDETARASEWPYNLNVWCDSEFEAFYSVEMPTLVARQVEANPPSSHLLPALMQLLTLRDQKRFSICFGARDRAVRRGLAQAGRIAKRYSDLAVQQLAFAPRGIVQSGDDPGQWD